MIYYNSTINIRHVPSFSLITKRWRKPKDNHNNGQTRNMCNIGYKTQHKDKENKKQDRKQKTNIEHKATGLNTGACRQGLQEILYTGRASLTLLCLILVLLN